jgi:hypothetical protein
MFGNWAISDRSSQLATDLRKMKRLIMKNCSDLMFSQMGNKTITHFSSLEAEVVHVCRMRGAGRVEWGDYAMPLSPFTQFNVISVVDRNSLSIYCNSTF